MECVRSFLTQRHCLGTVRRGQTSHEPVPTSNHDTGTKQLMPHPPSPDPPGYQPNDVISIGLAIVLLEYNVMYGVVIIEKFTNNWRITRIATDYTRGGLPGFELIALSFTVDMSRLRGRSTQGGP